MQETWDIRQALEYYKRQGAPADQAVLVSFLRELQAENGGCLTTQLLEQAAEGFGTKLSFLLAVIRRIRDLKLSDRPCLELCGGPNCSKRAALAAFVEKTYGKEPAGFSVKTVPCMRLCGKGPNIRWKGALYHRADEALVRSLIEK